VYIFIYVACPLKSQSLVNNSQNNDKVVMEVATLCIQKKKFVVVVVYSRLGSKKIYLSINYFCCKFPGGAIIVLRDQSPQKNQLQFPPERGEVFPNWGLNK